MESNYGIRGHGYGLNAVTPHIILPARNSCPDYQWNVMHHYIDKLKQPAN